MKNTFLVFIIMIFSIPDVSDCQIIDEVGMRGGMSYHQFKVDKSQSKPFNSRSVGEEISLYLDIFGNTYFSENKTWVLNYGISIISESIDLHVNTIFDDIPSLRDFDNPDSLTISIAVNEDLLLNFPLYISYDFNVDSSFRFRLFT